MIRMILSMGLLLGINLFATSLKTIQSDILDVSTSGTEYSYNFSVTIKSDDIDCSQYCDWWEIINNKGELIYRRILLHSHPDKQPFTRSGAKINISSKETIYIRAHMNITGYSGNIFKGSVHNGFKMIKDSPLFSKDIEFLKPQANECWY